MTLNSWELYKNEAELFSRYEHETKEKGSPNRTKELSNITERGATAGSRQLEANGVSGDNDGDSEEESDLEDFLDTVCWTEVQNQDKEIEDFFSDYSAPAGARSPDHKPTAEPAVDLSKAECSENCKQKLRALINEYRDCFANTALDLGTCDLLPVTIDTGNHAPIAHRMYRMSQSQQLEVNAHIDQLLKSGIIEKSESAWSFPCFVVSKKVNASTATDAVKSRFIVDYRDLNQRRCSMQKLG